MAKSKSISMLCAGTGCTVIAFLMQVGPDEAISNLAKWLRWLGIDNVPSWVLPAKIDLYISWASGMFAAICFLAAIYFWQMAQNGNLAAVVRGVAMRRRSNEVVNSSPAHVVSPQLGKVENEPATVSSEVQSESGEKIDQDEKIKITEAVNNDEIEGVFFNDTGGKLECSFWITGLREWTARHVIWIRENLNHPA